MTNPNPMPTAAEALTLAWKYASSPSTTEQAIRRAEVLLGIARELREEQQFRTLDERRRRLDWQRAGSKLEALGVPRSALAEPAPDAGAVAVEGWQTYAQNEVERTQQMIAEAPIDMGAWAASLSAAETQVVRDDPGVTQRIIAWAVGDKADCRHCHTPIVLCEPMVWRHKYTDQAVCADAMMAKEAGCDMGDEECSCERPSHTFAEPTLGG